MPEQAPTVGRIVHYVSYGTPGGEFRSQCRAAVVTELGRMQAECPQHGEIPNVAGDEVPGVNANNQRCNKCGWGVTYVRHLSLAILNPTGMFFNTDLPHDEDGTKGGTWHWPDRA